jgi:membrane protein YqaA with SNARE-associated domain
MDPGELIASVGVYVATFVVAVVGSVVPIVSIEVFLIAIALTIGPADAVPIVAIAAIGQVMGKLPIYFASRGVANLDGRHRRWLDRVRAWAAKVHPNALLAASATLGLPPFSLAATAAGVLAIPARTFALVVGVGRATRFAAIFALAG